MKRFGLSLISLLILISLSGCGDKQNEYDTSDSANVSQYSDLPTENDLSYFINPKNIAGQIILRTMKSPLSGYEKGLEMGSDRNIRKEKLNNFFNIDKYRVNAVATAEINSKDFSEFEIDEFQTKLKTEFKDSLEQITDNYKDVNKHIKITDLNIPVSYSKNGQKVANIKIKDIKYLDKLNISKSFNLSDFIKEELNNNYISKYIKPSKDIYNFEAKINYNHQGYSSGIEIKGNTETLNNIGKINKGDDSITEFTLHVWDSRTSSRSTHTTKFVITSFKLKSSDKRFVSNNYINLINTTQSFGNTYFIEDDDVEMYIKED
ncbi:MAG TPA: hypothetical protein ENK67_01865 [Flavobacteriia bacterium]|nr:hypothetical protein [Flavobacteriia bacterium]